MKIALLCPSRERLDKKNTLIQSILKTVNDINNVILYFGVDDDDPKKIDIHKLADSYSFVKIIELHNESFPGLSKLWNDMVVHVPDEILSMIGDDMEFVTKNWDVEILKEFSNENLPKDKLKMVHCFDGLGQHGDRVAVNFFYHRRYYEIVGRFIPEGFVHYYVDNWITDVFRSIGRRVYRHDITIKHNHFSVKGSNGDEVTNRLEIARKNSNDNQLWRNKQSELQSEVMMLKNIINNKKSKMICCPGRIGDIIITLPIAKHYYDLGYKIIWPINSEYFNLFNEYVDYVDFISLDCHVWTYAKNLKPIINQCSPTEIVPLCMTWPGFEQYTNLWKNSKQSFDEFRYTSTNIDFSKKWNLIYNRNIQKENELYNLLVKNKNYIIVHEDGSKAYHKNINITDNNKQIIKIQNVDGYSVFDWLKILSNAQELHLIDSCFSNFVEQMNLGVKKYFYIRSEKIATPVLRNKWEIVNG